jgi:hypothetical protein
MPDRARGTSALKNYWYFDLASITLALVIFAFPLSALFSALLSSSWGINDNTFSVASRVITFLAAVVLFAKRTLSGQSTWPNGALIAFGVLYIFRLGYDAYFAGNPAADSAIYFFFVATLIPTVSLACVKPKAWNERGAILLSLIVGTLFILLANWMLATGTGQEWVAQEIATLNGGRQSFERLNPIQLGHTAVTVILICVSLIVNGSSRRFQFVLACIIVPSIYIVFLAASRGPILALVAGLVLLTISNKRGLVIAAAGIICLIGLTMFSDLDFQSLLEQLRFSNLGTDYASVLRIDYLHEAFNSFLSSPVIGAGFEMPVTGGWPHNVFVEVLMATGLLGMVTFLWALFPALIRTIKDTQHGSHLAGIILLQSVVGAQFSGSLWGNTELWVGMAIVLTGLGAKSGSANQASNFYYAETGNRHRPPSKSQK